MSTTPLGVTSLAQAANAQLGVSLPVMYGPCRVRGDNILLQELSNKNRVAFYILGEKCWDGIDRLWINEKLVDITNTALVHFHPGLLGTLGAGLAPSSNGGDQAVDNFFSSIPGNFQPLTFSGKAYLAVNVPPDPQAPSANLDVLGDYRTSKCRIFDASGNQTGYSYTTNAAWQALDLILRKMIKPEWDPAAAGAAGGDLTAAEKARINFPAVVATAAVNDAIIANGQKRFETGVAFVQTVTLGQALQQLEMMSQMYIVEESGQIYIQADQLRASTFTLTSDHVEPGTASFDKINLHGAPNRLIAAFFDTNPQNSADIDTAANNGLVRAGNIVTVKTIEPHPYLVNDNVQIVADPSTGLPDPSFLGVFKVATVPDANHFTFAQTAANLTSGGGFTGTPESRFAPSSAVKDHEQHQNAMGARGLNLTPTFRKLPTNLDFGNNTMERTKRLMQFQLWRNLGVDQTPYVAPYTCSITAYLDAVDAANNALIAQLCGDVITIDSTISEEYQGQYEIMQANINTPSQDGSGSSSASSGAQQTTAPTIDLKLLQVVSGAYGDPAFQAIAVRASISRGGLPAVSAVDASGNTTLRNDLGAISVDNGNFEASKTLPVPGWTGSTLAVPSYETGSPISGSQSLKVTFTAQFAIFAHSRLFKVAPGRIYRIRGKIKGDGVGTFEIQHAFLDANLTYLGGGQQHAVSSSTSAVEVSSVDTAPAGAVYSQIWIQTDTAGTTVGIFDDISIQMQISPFEVQPVSTSMTPASGASPLSQSGVSTTINVAAWTAVFGDGSIGYNSGSCTATGFSVKNYVYDDDPGFIGGSPAGGYHATANISDLSAAPGREYLGNIVCAAGGGGTGGGGGNGNCVPDGVMIRQADGWDVAIEKCYEMHARGEALLWRTPWGSAAVDRIEIIEEQQIFDLAFDPAPSLARYSNTLPCSPFHVLKVWGLWHRAGEIYMADRDRAPGEQQHLHDARGIRVWIDGGVANLRSRIERPERARIFKVWLKEHHVYMTNGVWSHNALGK